MKPTPIFTEIASWREEIYKIARLEARTTVAKELRTIKKPSKQILEIIKGLEDANSKG